jgi:hypothetical protein
MLAIASVRVAGVSSWSFGVADRFHTVRQQANIG